MIRKKVIVLTPTGVDGSAAATAQVNYGRPGVVRFIDIDYQNQPSTTDIVIKRDTSTGDTVFTASNTNTDIDFKPVGQPGVDEGNAATAATDGLSGGWAFTTGLNVALAQGDGQTSGDEKVIITLIVEF